MQCMYITVVSISFSYSRILYQVSYSWEAPALCFNLLPLRMGCCRCLHRGIKILPRTTLVAANRIRVSGHLGSCSPLGSLELWLWLGFGFHSVRYGTVRNGASSLGLGLWQRATLAISN